VLAVLGSARQALRAAVDPKARCRAASEADSSLVAMVGTGPDVGEAAPVEGGYRGAALNLAARLCGRSRQRGIQDRENIDVGSG